MSGPQTSPVPAGESPSVDDLRVRATLLDARLTAKLNAALDAVDDADKWAAASVLAQDLQELRRQIAALDQARKTVSL